MYFPNSARVGLCLTVSLLIATSQPLFAAGPRPIGAGTHPLSFTDASAWFAHQANGTAKDLTVLFYFQGSPGWSMEATNFKSQIDGTPASIDMTVGKVPIQVKYWQDTDEVEIFGRRYSRSIANVYLISGIDSGKPTVSALGNHGLTFKPDEFPSVVLLRRDSSVWAAVTGHPESDHPLAKLNASEQIRAWDSEGLKLLESEQPDQERRACELFRRAAEKGYAPSQYRLGYCYESGRGVEQNYSTANEWYAKAGEQGHVDAQYKLGHSYRTGRGTSIDLATALNWYKKAAASGDSEALHNVAWMYATGQGTKTDQVEAYRWYDEAAKHGDVGSQFEVAGRLNDGNGVQKNPLLAYSWLLVLKAQQSKFQPEDWKQVQEKMTSIEGQLDAATKKTADVQSHTWMGAIAKEEMKRYGNQ